MATKKRKPKAQKRTILVKRKAYRRKDGTRVKATSFRVKDRGAKGRGPKVIKIEDEGGLGGPGYLESSVTERHRRLDRSIRRDGLTTTQRRVNALRAFGKRTLSKAKLSKLEADSRWLEKKRD